MLAMPLGHYGNPQEVRVAGTRRRRSANDDDAIARSEVPCLAGCAERCTYHPVRSIELFAQNRFDTPDQGESADGCLLRTDRDDRHADAVPSGYTAVCPDRVQQTMAFAPASSASTQDAWLIAPETPDNPRGSSIP